MRSSFKIFFSILILIILAGGSYFFWHQKQTTPSSNSQEAPQQEEQTFIEIDSQNDCSNECTQYQADQEKYNYCRAVCGFTVEEGVTNLPTSDNPELSKDYETKEAAVNEKNIGKCDEIKDGNIKKTCRARVTEDVLSQQSDNGF